MNAKNYLFLLGFLAGIMPIHAVEVNDQELEQIEMVDETPNQITLERFSMDRVAELRTGYTNRMRKVRWTVNGILGTIVIGGGTLIGYKLFKKNSDQEEEDVKEISDAIKDFTAPKPLDSDRPIEERKQRNDEIRVAKDYIDILKVQRKTLKSALKGDKKKRSKGEEGILGTPWAIVKLGGALGVAGLVLTTGHHILHVLSGTLSDSLSLWWRGYSYWYNEQEQRLRAHFNKLSESLQQARKVAQSGYDASAFTRTRSRQLGTSMISHYRADIITMYQLGLSSLERVVALMYIMAPEERHQTIYRYVGKLSGLSSQLTDSLQYDLNENTHGVLTHYSNKTLDLYHEMFESVQIFLTTYRAYLHRG